MKGYDAWKTTEPASADPGRLRHPKPEPFCCLDCDWRGQGYTARALHGGNTGHRIVWGGDPRALARQERKQSA